MTIAEVNDFLGVSYLRNTELFGNLRAHLRGVAVDSLTAAEHYVVVAELLHGLSQRIGSGKGVGAAENAVGENDATVGTAENAFTHYFGSAGKAHCKHCDGRTGICVL